MSEPALQTFGLTKRFGQLTAVEDLDLEVRQGEVYGFLGPNGSGKTTTIAMCLGLLHPSAGSVRVLGQKVTAGRTGALRGVGSLVGTPALLPHLSARANLRLLTRLHPGVDGRRVDEVLTQLGLASAADRRVKGYSLGMKQRLGLAAALLHRPRLLVLDEPTNGLDPAGMREIRELIRTLADQGVTVFLSSHLLHEVEQVCDRLTVLSKGRAVASGSVGELRGATEVVRVRVPDPSAAARILASLTGVTVVRPNGRYVEVEGVKSEQVIVRLVEESLVPSEVLRVQGDLESVFLSLTASDGERG